MGIKKVVAVFIAAFAGLAIIFSFSFADEKTYTDYSIDAVDDNLLMVWQDSNGNALKNFYALKTLLAAQGKQLVFATNGGMYTQTSSPLGLYIEKGKQLHFLNTRDAGGNFYLKPNGVFYITQKNKAHIVTTPNMTAERIKEAKYATQSGPMLLVDGEVHPEFKDGSANINIRNGVGILPNGGVVFSISNQPVNLYDFAMHFKNKGCKNALYLDGFVSKMYLPSAGKEGSERDRFGVMIAVVK